ncbi:hypothetical protein BZG36_00153 [Bifiguratus adelaidae]|uniref:Uncharacterized protein n=1 Tax=Bifiguratus adelaidae TaxID=1938954 RepID=A0A261Y8K2_9FUNG|nr:hypothetical protein BZG36_00153 [Bifiguratus adelaidae]
MYTNAANVKVLDMGGYTYVGGGRTDAMLHKDMTSASLLLLLSWCRQLQVFVAGESLDGLLNADVIRGIFSLPHLVAVDFFGCSSAAFTKGFESIASDLDKVREDEGKDDAGQRANGEQALLRWDHFDDARQDCVSPPCSPISEQALDVVASTASGTSTAVKSVPLTHLPFTLVRVSLHNCPTIAINASLVPFLRSLSPKMTHLDLSSSKIFSSSLQHIPTAELTHLNLAKTRALTCSAVIQFLSQCPKLEYLNLSADVRMGGSGYCHDCLLAMLEHCPSVGTTLKTLDLSGSLNMTDEFLHALASRCGNSGVLTSLSIAHAPFITVRSGLLPFLSTPVGQALQYLDVTGVHCLKHRGMDWEELLRTVNTRFTSDTIDSPARIRIELSKDIWTWIPDASTTQDKGPLRGWIKNETGRRCSIVSTRGNGEPLHTKKLDVALTGNLSPMLKYYSFAV